MSDIQIKITNLPHIQAAFKMAPTLMRKELNLAIRKTILNIKGRELVQYKSLGIGIRTHGLINSIATGQYFGELKGEVGPNVTGNPGQDNMRTAWRGITHYSLFVHNGTRYMDSRPFLLNAVNDAETSTDQYFKQAVENVLNQIGSKAWL